YTKWLARFGPVATSVPWQTYPGHEPCPLPVGPELHCQWARTRPVDRSHRRSLLCNAREMLGADSFPHALLNRRHLMLATWMYWLGLGDYGYIIKAAHPYFTYWARSDGNYVLPAQRAT